jgi:hypothetical protein
MTLFAQTNTTWLEAGRYGSQGWLPLRGQAALRFGSVLLGDTPSGSARKFEDCPLSVSLHNRSHLWKPL